MNIRLSFRLITCVFCISVSLWGCGSGGGGGAPPPDTTPPISSIGCSPTANAAGWNNGDAVECRIVATDNSGSSAVTEIRVRINDAPEQIVDENTATVPITSEGDTILEYFAFDRADNEEKPHNSVTIRIDRTPPSIEKEVSPKPDPTTGWNNTSDVKVVFTCFDDRSGLVGCPSEMPVLIDGAGQVFTGNTSDKAGNRSSTSVRVNLDRKLPTVLSTTPTNGDKGVDPDTIISVAFSEQMAPSTLTPNTFILKAADSNIPGAVSLSGSTATFKPSTKLEFSTSHTATLTSSVKDLAGNSLATNFWSFETRDRAWGTATMIENSDLSASNPQVAMDASGNAMAVWIQGIDIWANRFAAGSGWTPSAATAIDPNDFPASNPQVAMDAGGNAISVWSLSDSKFLSIWANRFVSGTVWSNKNAITIENNSQNASNPKVAMNPTGNGMAVWMQNGDTDVNSCDFCGLPVSPDHFMGIWASRWNGLSWGIAADIRRIGGDAGSPQVAMDGFGNAMVVWVQGNEIRARRYKAGSGLESAVTQFGVGTVNALSPQVAMDGSGNAMVVWVHDNRVLARRYVADTGWESALTIQSDPGSALNPQVAMDTSGDAMVVWVQGIDIWANRYEAGSSWSPNNATRIEDFSGTASNPRVAMDERGNAIAVWVQGIDILANRYVVGRGWDPSPRVIENSSDPAKDPQVAMNISGNAVVVWVQSDGKAPSIWVNGFN